MTIGHILPAVFQHDAVIAGFDMTITNPDMSTVIHVDAIAIPHLQAVENSQPGDIHVFAAGQLHRPIRSLFQRQIMKAKMPTPVQPEHERPAELGAENLRRFLFHIVAAPAINHPTTGKGKILAGFRPNPNTRSGIVILKVIFGEFRVIRMVFGTRTCHEHGAGFYSEFDVAFQGKRTR